MALINTLRNKMGKVVVAFVAVAILSFTLNDILGSNSVLFGNDNSVGEIAGDKITLEEFQQVLDFQERNFTVYANRQPTESDKFMINERAWLWLTTQYAFSPEYKKVGVEVSADEEWDMLQGTNIDPTIRAFFSNQQTGEFDRDAFLQFYRNKNTYDQNTLYVWNAIYPTIKTSRERMKYENLIIKSEFASQSEGNFAYHSQSNIAEANYLYIPFYNNSDTTVEDQVTEAKLREEYNDNKDRYKGENLRSLKYVEFPIISTADDTLDIKTEMSQMIEELKNVTDDEIFAKSNSDGATPFGRYHYGTIPFTLSSELETLSKGDIKGPYIEGNNYVIYKVADIYEDTVDYARASHILIQWEDETDEKKAEARTEATRILNEIKNGANFAILARQHGTDNSAQAGGDLGWFDSNTMVEEFEIPIFNATSTGLHPNLVETEFGYHIIEVTETKTNKMYAVASIERLIGPSNKTRDESYRKADLFQSNSSDLASFTSNAESEGFEIVNVEDLTAMDRSAGNLGLRSRQIVQWVFNKAKVDMVSDLYELDDKYVIAVMSENIEKGIKPFETVKDEVKTQLVRKLEAEYIIGKLGSLSGSLEEIAQAYGEDASVHTVSDLKLETNSLANVGFDPRAVGKIFSLKSGETSKPFYTDNGVFIAEMINLTEAPEVADYSSFSAALQTTRANASSVKISKVIEEDASIEDRRYKVY